MPNTDWTRQKIITEHTAVEALKDRSDKRPNDFVVYALLGGVRVVNGIVCEHFLVLSGGFIGIEYLDHSPIWIHFHDLLKGAGFLFVAQRPTPHYHLHALVADCLGNR